MLPSLGTVMPQLETGRILRMCMLGVTATASGVWHTAITWHSNAPTWNWQNFKNVHAGVTATRRGTHIMISMKLQYKLPQVDTSLYVFTQHQSQAEIKTNSKARYESQLFFRLCRTFCQMCQQESLYTSDSYFCTFGIMFMIILNYLGIKSLILPSLATEAAFMISYDSISTTHVKEIKKTHGKETIMKILIRREDRSHQFLRLQAHLKVGQL